MDGLTLEGSFAAKFDAAGNMQLAGAVDLAIDGFASVNGEFAVTRVTAEQPDAQIVSAKAIEQARGSVTRVEQGGVQTPTTFHLAAASGSGSTLRFREGAYVFARTGSSVSISSLGVRNPK